MAKTNDSINKEQNEKNREKSTNKQTIINVLILFTAFFIFLNAAVIYYLINFSEYAETVETSVDATNTQDSSGDEKDTISNIISDAISAPANNTVTVDSTVVNNKKIQNEELIVLYNGCILDTTKMGQVELSYIDNNNPDKDKYVITYYNYENYAFTTSNLGTLSSVYEGFSIINNVGKVAISESYDAVPRDVKIVNTLPTLVLENNQKLAEYDSVKTIISDLDGNGTEEYVIILVNKRTGYSKIAMYDSLGKIIDDLAYIEKSKWGDATNIEYYLSLDNVNILDIDNDGIMELLIEIPKYEGEPSVSLLKYSNNTLDGKKNIECSLLP